MENVKVYEGLQKENVSFWGKRGGIIRCLKKELLRHKKHKELMYKTISLCIVDQKTTDILEYGDRAVAEVVRMLRKLD